MRTTTTTLVITTGLVAVATAQNSTCVSGNAVHMIVARASLEPAGTGILGNISTRVTDQLPGSNTVAVDYPATLDNYTTSEGKGVAAMMSLVTSYASACPDSKMVLMGYSQGAQVTADLLCGTMENGFASTQALSTSIQDKIAAVVLMGDPSKAMNESFLAGTSTKNAIFPRKDTTACDAVKSRMVSFCNANDTFCDSGSSLEVHLSYVQANGTSAVDFVVKNAKGEATNSSSVSSGKGSGSSSSNNGTGTVTTNAGSKAFASVMGATGLALGFFLVM